MKVYLSEDQEYQFDEQYTPYLEAEQVQQVLGYFLDEHYNWWEMQQEKLQDKGYERDHDFTGYINGLSNSELLDIFLGNYNTRVM